MSTSLAPVTSAQVTWAPVARVNLLPPEIDEARRLRRLQRVLAACVAGTLLVVVGGYVTASHSVNAAEDDVAVVRAQTQRLQREQATYAEVPRVKAELTTAQERRSALLANDILWSRFVDDIQGATPTGLTVDSLQLQQAPAAATPDAATASAVGQLSLSGKARSLDQLSQWLETLADVAGLTKVTLTSANEGGVSDTGRARVAYAITADITAKALSHRYDRKAG